jgi:hypothetical protein
MVTVLVVAALVVAVLVANVLTVTLLVITVLTVAVLTVAILTLMAILVMVGELIMVAVLTTLTVKRGAGMIITVVNIPGWDRAVRCIVAGRDSWVKVAALARAGQDVSVGSVARRTITKLVIYI